MRTMCSTASMKKTSDILLVLDTLYSSMYSSSTATIFLTSGTSSYCRSSRSRPIFRKSPNMIVRCTNRSSYLALPMPALAASSHSICLK